MRSSTKILTILIITAIFIFSLTNVLNKISPALFADQLPQTTPAQSTALFARCLASRGLRMYGTTWCPSCKKQRQLFGPAFAYIPEVNCDEQPQLCRARGIRGYPVWEDAAGNLYPGALTFSELAAISGCPSPSFRETGARQTPPLTLNPSAASGSGLTLLTAFLAGLLSFLAPCLLPLLPSYFSAITGFTFSDMYGAEFGILRFRFFISTIFFTLGFAIIYSLLGATASTIGQFIESNFITLLRGIGAILILLGLSQTGLLKFDALRFDYAWNVQKRLARLDYLSSLVTGIVSALVWIPCVGPILGSILLLAGLSATAREGILLLFVYSLGIGTPFLVLSLAFPYLIDKIQTRRRGLHYLSQAAGAIMLAFGTLLLLNLYTPLLSLLPTSFPGLTQMIADFR